jgi:1,4-alpha-glucan branching enzyme
MSDYNGQLGVSKSAQGYQFAVWAPHAKAVSIVGGFNEWNNETNIMQQVDGGIWWCCVDNANNSDEYKFAIKTNTGALLLKNDPRARRLTNSVGNSIIFDDAFNWVNMPFTAAPLHERVIYELHIGTFNKTEQTGTFDSAIQKLPDLASLGINVVELMPINEFAGDVSWGYNPAYPFAVEEAYGGPNELKRFIDAAHGLGIAVIVDVVYNHFGPSDLDLWQFDGWSEDNKGGIYFYNDGRSITPWGDTRPDYGRQEVRDYILDNAMMWLQEYHADGLRMDMIPYMRTVQGTDDGTDDIAEGYELIKIINTEIHTKLPEKMSIAEDLHGHDYITNAVDDEGLGYSAQWDAKFVHPIRHIMTTANNDDIDLASVKDALLHCYSHNPFARVVYTESHDEIANGKARVVEEVAPGNVDDDYFARQKGILCAVAVLTSAGIPMLFQGQELKSPGWFDDTRRLEWDRRQQFPEYYDAFKRLIALRRNTNGGSAGLTGGRTDIIHEDPQHKVIGYQRQNAEFGEKVYVYLNLSDASIADYTLNGLPTNTKCIFAWDDGLVNTEKVNVDNGAIHLPSYGALIFA